MAIPDVRLNVDRRGYAGPLVRPIHVGAVAPGSGIRGSLQGMFEEGLRLRQRLMEEQLKAAQQQRSWDNVFNRRVLAGNQRRPQELNYGEAAESLLSGPRAYREPGDARKLAQMLRFFGPEAAHRGLMQTGAALSGQGNRGAVFGPETLPEGSPYQYGTGEPLEFNIQPRDYDAVRSQTLPRATRSVSRATPYTNRDFPRYKEGTVPGVVPKTEKALVHEGEVIVPKEQVDDWLLAMLREHQLEKVRSGEMSPAVAVEGGYQSGTTNPYLFDAVRRLGGLSFQTRVAPEVFRTRLGKSTRQVRRQKTGLNWEKMVQALGEEGYRLPEGMGEDDFYMMLGESRDAKLAGRPEPTMNVHTGMSSADEAAQGAYYLEQQAADDAAARARLAAAGPVEPVRGPQEVLPADPAFERGRRVGRGGTPAAAQLMDLQPPPGLPLGGPVPEDRALTATRREMVPRGERGLQSVVAGGEPVLPPPPRGTTRGWVGQYNPNQLGPGRTPISSPATYEVKRMAQLGPGELIDEVSQRTGIAKEAFKKPPKGAANLRKWKGGLIGAGLMIGTGAVLAMMDGKEESEGDILPPGGPPEEPIMGAEAIHGPPAPEPTSVVDRLKGMGESALNLGLAPFMLGPNLGQAAGEAILRGDTPREVGENVRGFFDEHVGGAVETLGDVLEGLGVGGGTLGEVPIEKDDEEEQSSPPMAEENFLDRFVREAEEGLESAKQTDVTSPDFREAEGARQIATRHRDSAQKLYKFISDNIDSMSDKEYDAYLRRAERQDKLAQKLEQRIDQITAKTESHIEGAQSAVERARETRVAGILAGNEGAREAQQKVIGDLDKAYDKILEDIQDGRVDFDNPQQLGALRERMSSIMMEIARYYGQQVSKEQAMTEVDRTLAEWS